MNIKESEEDILFTGSLATKRIVFRKGDIRDGVGSTAYREPFSIVAVIARRHQAAGMGRHPMWGQRKFASGRVVSKRDFVVSEREIAIQTPSLKSVLVENNQGDRRETLYWRGTRHAFLDPDSMEQ